MKRICLLLTGIVFINAVVKAQLTGTKNIPGDYATLSAAINDLNAQGVGAGGVIFNIITGNPQTAPVGGYIIGNTGSAILSGPGASGSTKTITIEGNGNNITAFTPQVTGSVNDAVFKLVGADWVTIARCNIQENSSNTVISPNASNNMTEWGIAFVHADPTDGAQHNTILSNTIEMERLYRNSFGIYSVSNFALNAVDLIEEISSPLGANSYNTFHANIITNVNYPMYFSGSNLPDYYDTGLDVGGTSVATNNVITDWGYLPPLQTYMGVGTGSPAYGIALFNQADENISWNTIVSTTVNNDNGIVGIFKNDAYINGVPAGLHTATFDHNTVTVHQSSASATADLFGIYIYAAIPNAGFTISITGNTIADCSMTGAGASTTGWMIANASACGTLSITGNTIRGNTTAVLGSGSFFGIANSGAVSDQLSISNNQLGIAGSGMVSSTAPAGIGPLSAIRNTGAGVNAVVAINNNSIDGIACAASTAPILIRNEAPTANAISISNNRFGTVTGTAITISAASTGPLYAIFNASALSNCTVSISGNDVRGMVNTVSGVQHRFIWNAVATLSQTISNNTFTNLVSRCTGNVYFIRQLGDMPAGGSFTCSNNRIVGTYNKTLAGGQVYFLQSSGNAGGSSTITQSNNNFSNVTLTGNTVCTGWDEQQGISEGSGPIKTISNNTFSNITVMGTGVVSAVFLARGTHTLCSGNTISNITAQSSVYGIHVNIGGSGGSYDISTNTVTGLSCSAGGAEVTGIRGGAGMSNVSIVNNNISNLSSTLAAGDATGISFGGTATGISRNTISGISCNNATGVIAGISVSGGAGVTLFRNRISGIAHHYSGAISTPCVHGLLILNGTTITAYSNFIAALTAPAVSGTDVIRGISIISSAASTSYNIYYNSVYIDAASSGTNFGTTAVFDTGYATATTAAMTLINNIFVNTSVPSGIGTTTVFRRSGTALDNYTAGSDNNLFYAGTPGPARLIFNDGINTDQTLAAYQLRVSGRDAGSISEMPVFVSPTDLHLFSNVNCRIDRKGKPIPGVVLDIDGLIRDVTTPDIGADEFTIIPSDILAGIVGSTVCDDRVVHPAGSDFANNNCELIARLSPTGASPVTGHVTACVYIDPATVPVYNAEPYVQRHIDIMPANNPLVSTGRVTLCFNDADFVTFNANNSAFPDLPTAAGGGNADPNRANLRVSQYHGTALTSPSSPNQYSAGTATLIDPADGNIFWNGDFWQITFDVTGFSGFYVHTNLRYVLPIEVNYFRGSKQGSNHLLDWKVTCNSTPKATLTLERSSNATGGFTSLYSIEATAARCNQPFSHTDAQPLPGMNYYRVKMVDAEGKVTYSTTVALLNAIKGFDIVSIAPNPVVSGNVKLNVTAATIITMDLVILDMQGRVVQRRQLSAGAGFSSIDIDVASLSPGTYSLYAVTNEGRSSVLRLVKQ